MNPLESRDVPRNEDRLRAVLGRVEECRRNEDDVALGYWLLKLCGLVKWVRSDTEAPPFVRAHELALEAVATFRRTDDRSGLARALVEAARFSDASSTEAALEEAEFLADPAEDPAGAAGVLAARANRLFMSDREESVRLQRRTLDLYRAAESRGGEASSLFRLILASESWDERQAYAREAARLYRSLNLPDMAARALQAALGHGGDAASLDEREELVREGLRDSLDAKDRSLERSFYERLAALQVERGDDAEAERCRRRAVELGDSDGLTESERWTDDVVFVQSMLDVARRQENADAIELWTGELERLNSAKPREGS